MTTPAQAPPRPDLALAAANEAAGALPAGSAVTPYEPMPNWENRPVPDGKAVIAKFTGAVQGVVTVLVGNDLVKALRNSPFGALEVDKAIFPALEAAVGVFGPVVLEEAEVLAPDDGLAALAEIGEPLYVPLLDENMALGALLALVAAPWPVEGQTTPPPAPEPEPAAEAGAEPEAAPEAAPEVAPVVEAVVEPVAEAVPEPAPVAEAAPPPPPPPPPPPVAEPAPAAAGPMPGIDLSPAELAAAQAAAQAAQAAQLQAAQAAMSQQQGTALASAAAARQTYRGASLDLLHDVEMSLTAELGRTAMTVRELLSLTPGAVVELDRAAGSPADLLVNGRLIARGEVVVIDENFGIRITEILEPSSNGQREM